MSAASGDPRGRDEEGDDAAMPAPAAKKRTLEQGKKPQRKKRKRQRAAPLAAVPLQGWRPLTSQKEARKVTSKFHELTRILEGLESDKTPEAKLERAKVQAQLDHLGGRKRYQEASMLLTSLNKSSSKWVFQNITKLGMRPARGAAPLRVLEVGAINTQLLSSPWLDVTAIDLKSRHPSIREMDFFDVPVDEPARFDVICNAMVVNCVPTKEARGDMLVRCARLLKKGGLFCLVLPLRCVGAPSKSAMPRVLGLLGLDVVHTSESPKIAFFAAQKSRHCWHGDTLTSHQLATKLNAVNLRAADSSFVLHFSAEMFTEHCCCD